MKSTTLVIAAAAIAVFAQSAQAHEHHYQHHHHRLVSRDFAEPQLGWTRGGAFAWQSQPYVPPAGFGPTAPGFGTYPQRTTYRGRNDGRPSAWCGWELRR